MSIRSGRHTDRTSIRAKPRRNPFGTLIALHAFVIRRVPALAFLFNGKPLKRAQ